jgi:hypothetical protein
VFCSVVVVVVVVRTGLRRAGDHGRAGKASWTVLVGWV